MGGFFSKWFNEGIATTPPPCMYSKTCYNSLSKNAFCLSIGKWGTEWGEKNRSQIMFVAFWFSFVSLALSAAAVACLSTDSKSIKNVPFFTGVLTVEKVDGSTSDFNIYAGLNRVVVEDCDLGALCPPDSISWNSVHCDQYFTDCGACASASLSTVPLVIMSFFAQIPQCMADVSRSMGKYDLHCQKFMGILSGVLGVVGTCGALYAFADSCLIGLDSALPNLSLSTTPGTAFVLLLLSIVLKVVDIWAHVIVPVPKENYWAPSGANDLIGNENL